MDFKDLLHLARRRWKTVASIFLLAVAASAAITFTATPVYHSTTRLFISTGGSSTADAFYGNAFAAQRVKSYAELATSRELMKRVVNKLGLNLTTQQLAQKIGAAVETDTVILRIEVRDPDPALAQKIAEVEAKELASYLSEVEATDAGTTDVKASIISPADYVASPVSPNIAVNLAGAALLGLLLGAAIAVLRDVLDNTISGGEDIQKLMDAPVLASVGFDKDVPDHPLVSDEASHAPRTEAFRLLRTNLQFLDLDNSPRSIVVTSALEGEGKTSTAANLAIALAQIGRRVLLIDADLRRPKASGLLGLERSVGLTTVLVGRSKLIDSIQRHTASGVYFLASGPVPPNPTEILQSNAAKVLIDEVSEMFDMVIIDSPPLLPASDAAITAREADGALLVIRHGKTTKEQVRQAHSRLEHVGARVLGVVVNMTPKRGGLHYGYGYGYEYEPSPTHSKPTR